MRFIALAFISAGSIINLAATETAAQSSNLSASQNWHSSYGIPSPTERNVRLNFMVEQQKLRNGFYQAPVTTINTTNNNSYVYDHSVSNSVNAGAGAVVDLENRTAEGSGTSTNVIGAVNTSTNTITTSGVGNAINIANAATSEAGCIDGAVTTAANRPVGGIDISSGASAAGAGGSSFSVSRGECR